MVNNQYKVWIEAEEWESGWNIYDDNTDVVVEFNNGERWIASFFTYSNISILVQKNKQTGECLAGKYFWSSEMLLVDEVSRERIEEVIGQLICGGEFFTIFRKGSNSQK